jgi:hypothetical protein
MPRRPRLLPRLATLLAAATLALPAILPAAEAATLVQCPFNGPGGDNLTRGFYVTNFQGKSLDTVTLSYNTGVEGTRTLRLVARLSAYNGAILGTATTVAELGAATNKVVFEFGNVPITPGATITFAQSVLAGSTAITYDIGATSCGNITQTDGTSAPLDDFRRQSVGIVITGDPVDENDALLAFCPATFDGPGEPLSRGIVIHNFRGVGISLIQLKHRTTSPGVKTIALVARLHAFDGPILGTASVTRNVGTSFSNSTFASISFDDAVVPAGSTVVLTQALTAGTSEVLFDPGYGPCKWIETTNGTTPPLDDPIRGEAYLAIGGRVASPTPVLVVEYYNASQNHYFITADLDEIALLDGGGFGGAFARTGANFWARNGPAAGTDDVCRFFTVAFAPLGSHFYTSYDFECAIVKEDPVWIYEKLGFFVRTPVAGACLSGQPVYRLYNNGQSGAPNHRYTRSTTVYEDFIANRGWIGEGVVFCGNLPPA